MSVFSRRDFLKAGRALLVATGLAAVAGPVVGYFYPPKLEQEPSEPVPAGALEDLPEGASTMVPFGRYPAMVVHTSAGLRAYSAVCTHFACICQYDATLDQIVCPCHDGFFAVDDGRVLAGPPPRPLKALPVEVVDGEILVGGKA
jgi:nitrite reductase/ring-hydroxylating ferredoxin subunit